MARARKAKETDISKKIRPAITPENRENQMIALAVDCAEKQLRDGTASPSVITHYLKLGSQKESKEREKLEEEIKLLRAKTEALKSGKRIEEMLEEGFKAFTRYHGGSSYQEEEEFYEEYED